MAKTACFVLIHGAWHGGWCWRRVVPLLRDAGHAVYAPSLTGLGDRVHLAHPGIDLGTHIQDVVSLAEMEELENIVLVGHSYGGMVITGAAERIASSLRRLVYIDAFLPENGCGLLDYAAAERAATMRNEGETAGMVSCPPLAVFGVTRPGDVAWVSRHLTKQPYRTLTQPVALDLNNAAVKALPKTYVHCTSPSTGSFEQFAGRLRNDPAWQFFEVQTGHDAMITEPEALSRILLQSV